MGTSAATLRSLKASSDDGKLVSELLREHGACADAVAMQLALEARAAQDRAGEAKWLQVFDMIRALTSHGRDASRVPSN